MSETYINRRISILYRYGQRYFFGKLKDYELELGQFPFLIQVLRHPGIIQEQIAANTGMDKGTTARGIAQLEERGFVQRRSDPYDRRINHVWPTQRALDIQEPVYRVIDELHQVLYKGLTEEEIEQATSLLERMCNNLHDSLSK